MTNQQLSDLNVFIDESCSLTNEYIQLQNEIKTMAANAENMRKSIVETYKDACYALDVAMDALYKAFPASVNFLEIKTYKGYNRHRKPYIKEILEDDFPIEAQQTAILKLHEALNVYNSTMQEYQTKTEHLDNLLSNIDSKGVELTTKLHKAESSLAVARHEFLLVIPEVKSILVSNDDTEITDYSKRI